jgi:hypothetical protein
MIHAPPRVFIVAVARFFLNLGDLMKVTLFGRTVKFSDRKAAILRATLPRTDMLKKAVAGKSEDALFELLAFEYATQRRAFALERIYSKYNKARSRRENIELLTDPS